MAALLSQKRIGEGLYMCEEWTEYRKRAEVCVWGGGVYVEAEQVFRRRLGEEKGREEKR